MHKTDDRRLSGVDVAWDDSGMFLLYDLLLELKF